MSGFVVIIANQPDGSVAETDIDAFASVYRALRGGRSEAVRAGDRLRAVAFARPDGSGAAIHRRATHGR